MPFSVWSNPTKTEEEVEEDMYVSEHCLVMKAREVAWKISGGDARGGHTRTHPEHDG